MIESEPESHQNTIFICGICNKIFLKECHLTEHLKVHIAATVQAAVDNNRAKDGVAARRMFSRRSSTGEWKLEAAVCTLKVELCSAPFANEAPFSPGRVSEDVILSREVSPHSQHINVLSLNQAFGKYRRKRAFECRICGRHFRFRLAACDHVNLHTNQKPYKCRFCSVACRSSPARSMHERRKHSDLLSVVQQQQQQQQQRGGGGPIIASFKSVTDQSMDSEASSNGKDSDLLDVDDDMYDSSMEGDEPSGPAEVAVVGQGLRLRTQLETREVRQSAAVAAAPPSRYQCAFCPMSFSDQGLLMRHLQFHRQLGLGGHQSLEERPRPPAPVMQMMLMQHQNHHPYGSRTAVSVAVSSAASAAPAVSAVSAVQTMTPRAAFAVAGASSGPPRGYYIRPGPGTSQQQPAGLSHYYPRGVGGGVPMYPTPPPPPSGHPNYPYYYGQSPLLVRMRPPMPQPQPQQKQPQAPTFVKGSSTVAVAPAAEAAEAEEAEAADDAVTAEADSPANSVQSAAADGNIHN